MTTPKIPARLDADRTAQPHTRIVLTPSELMIAKTLAAYEECRAAWLARPDEDRGAPIMYVLHIEELFQKLDLVDGAGMAPKGRALLDRARKAGVL